MQRDLKVESQTGKPDEKLEKAGAEVRMIVEKRLERERKWGSRTERFSERRRDICRLLCQDQRKAKGVSGISALSAAGGLQAPSPAGALGSHN